MINRTILFLIVQSFIFCSFVLAQEQKIKEEGLKEKAISESKKTDDIDNQVLNDFLSDPKNPFLSLLPEEKPVIKTPEVKKVTETKSDSDPNKIPDSVVELSDKLKLNGVVWGTDQPQAILNDQLVGEGDALLGAKVVKITQKGVQIKYNGYSIFVKNKIE